jgi:hypothetical protein
MTTAREEVLLFGLIDWVHLARIHWFVAQDNANAPLSLV